MIEIALPLVILTFIVAVVLLSDGRQYHPHPGGRLWEPGSPAELRAEAMLKEVLAEVEYERLITRGYLEVTSPSIPTRTYRIPRRRGQVKMYENGVPVVALCVQPTDPIPDADLVLLHKVLIEADEDRYLATANHFDLRRFAFSRV